MMYFLDFRGRDHGGPVVPGRVVTVAGAASGSEDELRRESRVIFLIHGFNVDRAAGQRNLSDFAGALVSSHQAAIVAVLWPGDSWANALSYPLEGNDADDTAAELARFVHRVLSPTTQLSFVSHSLGARVIMETIKRLPRGMFKIAQTCMMAAAIDDDSVSASDAYRMPVEQTTRVAVLASQGDRVLKFAYPAGDVLQSFLFFWKDTPGLALGLHGPRDADRQKVPNTIFHTQVRDDDRVDHGDYLFNGIPNPKQAAAGRYADAVLAGAVDPVYRV